MDYGKIYEDYYSNYYDELELVAKGFFIENHIEGTSYNYASNEFLAYLYNDFCTNVAYLKNEKLNELYSLFLKRATIFPIDYNQKIFKNKIKPEFDKIDVEQLPKECNYFKFIEEIAFIESRNEISRLISAHAQLFEMIYKLNRFDVFEIRYYQGKDIEEYPNYGEMFSELYPHYKENENLGVAENELINPKKLPEKWYALLYWIELSANGQLPPTSKEGDFIKKDIEEYRKKITGKSGQSFYRSFIQIDLNNAGLLKNSFGSDWKNEIINLSNSNPIVIEYIQSKYTL